MDDYQKNFFSMLILLLVSMLVIGVFLSNAGILGVFISFCVGVIICLSTEIYIIYKKLASMNEVLNNKLNEYEHYFYI